MGSVDGEGYRATAMMQEVDVPSNVESGVRKATHILPHGAQQRLIVRKKGARTPDACLYTAAVQINPKRGQELRLGREYACLCSFVGFRKAV